MVTIPYNRFVIQTLYRHLEMALEYDVFLKTKITVNEHGHREVEREHSAKSGLAFVIGIYNKLYGRHHSIRESSSLNE